MEMQTFNDPWDMSDIVMIVEDELLHVHKSILSICSPVFKRMLSSDFKESATNEINLPGKKREKIREMLRHIYPFPAAISDDTDVQSLLNLAREYQMSQLTRRVEEALLRRQTSVELLLMAQEHELKKVIDKCTCTLSRINFNDIKLHPKFENISTENVVCILQNHVKYLKEQHQREIRNIRENNMKKRQDILDMVNDINNCWGYNKLPIRGCTCPSYTKSCNDCNNALEKFIKLKCAELFEHLQSMVET